jgi:hypothetical protein
MEDNKSKADQNIEPIIEVGGTKYIPLDIAEVEYYEIIKQPDGSIILKPYTISVLLKDKHKEGLDCSPTANPYNPITPQEELTQRRLTSK